MNAEPCPCGWHDASHISGVDLAYVDGRYHVYVKGPEGKALMASGPGDGLSMAGIYGEMHGVSVTVRSPVDF